MQQFTWFFVLALISGGCNVLSGSVSHRMDMVIPASVPSIEEGKLVASLFAYDPRVADKPADELDTEEVLFSHRQGTRTVKSVTLQGDRPTGFEVYATARGFERRDGEFVYVLWDAQEGTGMPSSVQMRPVNEPN